MRNDSSADGWQDDFATRLKAQALLQTFNADLLSHPSATLTLERWCGLHRLASAAHITAHLLRDVEKTPTTEQRRELKVDNNEPIKYRRVQLFCGEHILSEADNWYVPARLTAAMNRQLEQTDTPFGRAVKELNFRRETISANVLWSVLPEGWEMQPTPTGKHAQLDIPQHVLEHRAILYTQGNLPFSEVVETYTREIFSFPLTPPTNRAR
ncbi:hypothetical protein ELE36_07450 [Pseudolysobacter antarcticus]|uniref:Chorismate lyase n=1 Tax=Pseudolysobacter antarcticus TaxID=2511995 RepID=A0A411HQ74_9GAMM|nr:hypothetical protein ELE36_07450 [Pseudolysobacter antarcticus]